MPVAGASIRHGPWTSGVRYDLPAEEQSTSMLYAMSNTKVGLSGEVRKRLGFAKYIATALSSTTLTAVGYAQFSASSGNAFCVAGTALYEDMSGTWTERMPSSGVSITAATDNTFEWVNAGGTIVLTNGVNGTIKWAASGGDCAALDVDSRFSTADHVEYFDGRLWLANTNANEDRVWRSDAGDIETWGSTSFYGIDHPITGLKAFSNALAVHAEDGIWLLQPTGNSSVPFSVQRQVGSGTISGRALVTLPDGSQVFPRRDGIYRWHGGPVAKISGALDGSRYWDNINASRLLQSFAVVYPDQNEVWFQVPYGAGQSNMNHTIVFDYNRGIWYGPYEDYTRNCGAIVDDIPHLGGVGDGLLYKHDSGTNDNTAAIVASFQTGATPPSGGEVDVRWQYARHYFELKGDHSVQVGQRSTGIVGETESIEMGGSYAGLDSFVLGIDILAEPDLVLLSDTDLHGYDPHTSLRYQNSGADEEFIFRRVHLQYKPIGRTRQRLAGVE